MKTKREDTYRHKGLRKKLIAQLRAKGITDESVLEAMERIPRHFFLDSAFENHAYEDKAFQIGHGQTISQPFTVAYMTELLCVKKADKVLEIGTGSGYQACVLAELGAKVFSIERHRPLYEKTSKLLLELGYSLVKSYFGDGYEGLPPWAPFDRIIITAAAPEIPQTLLDQLKTGGYLVAPVGESVQQMIRLKKLPGGELEKEVFENFQFVPMLRGKVF